MIEVSKFKPIVLPDGSHLQVCTFMQMNAKDGILLMCAEPADMISNGAGCCFAHYKMMVEQSAAQMREYLKQAQEAHEHGGNLVVEDDEGNEVPLPNFDIKAPDYLG